MRRFTALLAGLLSCAPALAQTPGPFTLKQAPTSVQMNALFAGKADTTRLDAEIARALAAETAKADGAATTSALAATTSALAAKRDAALFPSPTDFVTAAQAGPLMSGGINAAPAIQAAWTASSARIPCGTYRLDGPLVAPSNSVLHGEADGCVRFLVTFPTGDA